MSHAGSTRLIRGTGLAGVQVLFIKRLDPTRRRQPLVLLAEDFEDARELYRDYLEFSGFSVHTAANGREAIDQAQALQPDIILMDASMPVLDGWQATRAIKADPTTKHIPILALTAHAFEDARRKAQDVGCDGFVTKPCLPDDLVNRIRAVLDCGTKKSVRPRPRGPGVVML